jgi:crossover junction endodeoxyribonuclease RuvC
MIIIGIDPGTQKTGYGIVRVMGNATEVLDFGCIAPPAKYKLSDRYLIIYEGVDMLLQKYGPEALAVEGQFVNKNPQSTLKLGMAKGVVLVAAKKRGLKVFEYSPSATKLAVVGNGHASKFQVQGMVQKLLRLSQLPWPEDASDALAVALCHAHSMNSLKSLEI